MLLDLAVCCYISHKNDLSFIIEDGLIGRAHKVVVGS